MTLLVVWCKNCVYVCGYATYTYTFCAHTSLTIVKGHVKVYQLPPYYVITLHVHVPDKCALLGSL